MPDKIRHIRGPEDFAAAFDVSRETIERMKVYEALLRRWQQTMNLVGPATLDDIWHRHFADSAQLLFFAPAARIWLDLGSGAGFPGLIVAILLADKTHRIVSSPQGRAGPPESGGARLVPHVTLIESNARKCAFLGEVARQTGIAGGQVAGVAVDILSIRSENVPTQINLQAPDVVSARALAPVDRLLELATPHFASHTVGLFLKGRDATKELETAQRSWDFGVELVQSLTERDGRVVVVRSPRPKSGLGSKKVPAPRTGE